MADQNVKLTALPHDYSVQPTDYLYLVSDPATAPVSKCVTVASVVGAGMATPLPVAQGGTGADDPAEARTSLDVFSRAEVQGGVEMANADGSHAFRIVKNQSIYSKDRTAAHVHLLGVWGDATYPDTVYVGDQNKPLQIDGTVDFGGTLQSLPLGNQRGLFGKTVAGVAKLLAHRNGADTTVIGDGENPMTLWSPAVGLSGSLTVTGPVTLATPLAGIAVASGYVTGSSGALAAGSAGIASVTRTSAGVYTVTWSVARASATYPVQLTLMTPSGAYRSVLGTMSTTAVGVRVYNAASTAVAADADFMVVAF